jgi:hypothetical protein
MDNPNNSAGKALYILLCAILGALLFVVIQHALALIYFVLVSANYQTYSFGLNEYQLSWINFLTVLGAVFFGFWYGIWLGLHWHDIVYEQGRGGLIHGFVRHWLPRGEDSAKVAPSSPAEPGVTTIKPTIRTVNAPPVKLTDRLQAESWDFDELKKDEPPAVMKTVVKSKPVKAPAKVKRKTAAKRADSAEE